jgi:hypothetical protein
LQLFVKLYVITSQKSYPYFKGKINALSSHNAACR